MTAWDRIHGYQLELAEKEARIRRLCNELFDAQTAEVQQRQNVTMLSEEVEALRRLVHARTEERDTARNIAVQLEQEVAIRRERINPFRCAICDGELVFVPVIGEAT